MAEVQEFRPALEFTTVGDFRGGRKSSMKHYSAEEWIDFVNHAGSQARQQEMQQHLESGCKRCKKTVSLWQKIRQTGSAEGRFQPPADTLRVVKAAFSGTSLERDARFGGIVAELIFDSFSQAAGAGARSSGMNSRQVLFRANPYQIDVNIESSPGTSRLSVTGQLLDLTQPDSFGSGILVTLSNRRGQTIQTVTNAHGEFCGELENRGDLELSFPGPGDKAIVVSLADALGYLATHTRAGARPPVRG